MLYVCNFNVTLVNHLHFLVLDYTAVAVSGKVGPCKPVNHTSWVAVVTPTDRPKSVRNRCLIELFVALFVLSLCPFDISVGVEAFVIGLSQISSFFSFHTEMGQFFLKVKVTMTQKRSIFASAVSLHLCNN